MQFTVPNQDFYSDDHDVIIRGAALLPSMPIIELAKLPHQLNISKSLGKCSAQFPLEVRAPLVPNDPLYVFTNWSWSCHALNVADLANAIMECIDTTFNRKCTLKADLDKVKISLVVPTSDLNVKIKFFNASRDLDSPNFLVMFRKDSGDWFAFSSLFQSCVKYVSDRGFCLSMASSQTIHQKDHAIVTE